MDDQIYVKELEAYNLRMIKAEEQIHALQNQIAQLKKEAIYDPETALFSNAYFGARLSEEIVRSERYRHFLSLILIHVELKNNRSTQQITRELMNIGREMTTGLTRRTDIVALYSKRQMIIVLPETDPRGAHNLIMRYQAMFPNNGRRLTYGVLTYPIDASNIELVLNRLQDLSEDLFRGETQNQLAG